MWRHLETILAFVAIEDLVGVNTEVTERVDGDQNMANVCVDLGSLETLFEVLVDRFVGDFAKKRQV